MSSPSDILSPYFEFSEAQKERFDKLPSLYETWNSQINVVSRKDVEQLMERHVLHSLAIAHFVEFPPGSRILDVGTGGGFPGIPLAIFYPDCDFVLVDSIGKKIKVVNEVKDALGLKNVEAFQARAEQVPGKFDFVVSRAVAPFPEIHAWVRTKIRKPGGLLCLKGGDLEEELSAYLNTIKIWDISSAFKEPFFETKKVVFLPF